MIKSEIGVFLLLGCLYFCLELSNGSIMILLAFTFCKRDFN
jgi:hypothetical protein